MTNTYKLEYYTETYKILLAYGEDYINRIPKKIFNNIKSNVNTEYDFEFNPKLSFKEQNIKKEAVALIVAFKLKYWCDSEEEKNEYKNLLAKNKEKHEKEREEKYSVDNLFKKDIAKEEVSEVFDSEATTDLQTYKENVIIKLYKRIKQSILNIFRKEN